MCSTVTSEIWQDQFLQSLSTDIFQDFSENENATEDDSNSNPSEPEGTNHGLARREFLSV
jgi:hypothetical protein